jgi:ATP-dependent Clp protease adaptor protein ClpS
MIRPSIAPHREEAGESEPALEPLFHLILLDDNDHTYQYVVELLGHVFGYAKAKAFALACVVDSEGRAIVETAERERVLRSQRRIHSYGRDPRIAHCAGSMSAVLEPAG